MKVCESSHIYVISIDLIRFLSFFSLVYVIPSNIDCCGKEQAKKTYPTTTNNLINRETLLKNYKEAIDWWKEGGKSLKKEENISSQSSSSQSHAMSRLSLIQKAEKNRNSYITELSIQELRGIIRYFFREYEKPVPQYLRNLDTFNELLEFFNDDGTDEEKFIGDLEKLSNSGKKSLENVQKSTWSMFHKDKTEEKKEKEEQKLIISGQLMWRY